LQELMHDYYVGPLVYEEVDGIRTYRFVIYLKDQNAIVYGELATLLAGVATVAENGKYRKIQISPLHPYPTMVRNQVVSFIEQKLGSEGYVERHTRPAVAHKVFGVVRTKDRTLTLGAYARSK
jgi:hypothetical protein